MELEEEWSDIPGFSNYLISNLGRVCNWKRETILKPGLVEKGYLQVRLYQNGSFKTRTIHDLVAQAFVPGWTPDLEVNHIDTDLRHTHRGYRFEYVD